MPLYWKTLASLDSLEILAHRGLWSFVFLAAAIILTEGFGGLAAHVRAAKPARGVLVLTGALITLNWYLYIWAVNHGRILETSLGYFINPLLSMALGVAVFRERLRKTQWLAFALAAAGVGVEIAAMGRVPVVSLGLALTFAIYGVLKKMSPLKPMTGMLGETALMTPFALAWLIYCQSAGTAFYPYALSVDFLLAGCGALTAIPLLMFAWGVSKVPLVLTGFIQYVSPTMTFLMGTFLYHEPLRPGRRLAFAFIWAGIAVYAADSARAGGKE
jgi:chloramphenicol-sensitive protein RarD